MLQKLIKRRRKSWSGRWRRIEMQGKESAQENAVGRGTRKGTEIGHEAEKGIMTETEIGIVAETVRGSVKGSATGMTGRGIPKGKSVWY